jgi:SAM-dependent methyltransferase
MRRLKSPQKSSNLATLIKRLAQTVTTKHKSSERSADEQSELQLDEWLVRYFEEPLSELDAACANAGPEAFRLFRELDDDLWAVLLSRQYRNFPNIRALMPGVPEPSLQLRWNGATGLELLNQGKAFYARIKQHYSRYSKLDLPASRVLDFGCGWGRMTRFFARDVEPGSLFGCDPVEQILDVCRDNRVPANLERSDFLPQRVPFDESFDLAFAFSVFTHISERAHEHCLKAIYDSLNPGGLLVLTIRPAAYLSLSESTLPLFEALESSHRTKSDEPSYIFVPHPPDPHHPVDDSGMHYGESVISLPYIRERWTPQFDLMEISLLAGDIYQVVVTLRRPTAH